MNIDFAKALFDQEEKEAVNKVLEGYWLASGKENEAFESEFAAYVGADHAICVNSGSSANLLALASLDLPKGSRVITSACGFPATLAPILHLGLEPVLVDYDLKTHNIDVESIIGELIESEIRNKPIEAIILAHTMGNPVKLDELLDVAERLEVYIIEDCCEAVGSKMNGSSVGTFGDIGTFSFYPAHQITAGGGGGMIVTHNDWIARDCKSLRDWGKIWDWNDKMGDSKTAYRSLVDGIEYYKGYTYQTVGFNMKLPEMNAAFGRVQLKKLDEFSKIRMENYKYLKAKMADCEDFIQVDSLPNAQPSWFGYILTLKEGRLNRNLLGNYLESVGIRTRPFFAGNITRHEPFKHLKGDFPVADKLMRDTLFVGVGPWISKHELDYISEKVKAWILSPYPS